MNDKPSSPDQPLPTPTPPHAAGAVSRRWAALALLCSTMFMVILDTATVTTALPSIQQDLGFTTAGLPWVVTTYTLTFGSLMLLGGRLSDLLGRRRVFVAGNVIFLLASLTCGLAATSGMLLTGRVVQGVGSAIMIPAGLSILMVLFEEGPARNRALSWWGSVASAGGIAGFVVGGRLTDGPGWEWIFFMNLPLGVIVLVLTPALIADSREVQHCPPIDLAGAASVTGGLVALVAAVTTAPEVGWTAPLTVALLLASAVLIAGFVGIESRVSTPLVPLRLVRSRTLVGGNLVLLTAGMLLAGVPFILTLYTQDVLGWSASLFAAVMLAPATTTILGFAIGERLMSGLGPRRVVAVGTMVMMLGIGPLVRLPQDGLPIVALVGTLGLFGVGFGMINLAGQVAALAGTVSSDAGVAGGLSESTPMIGQPLGVALLSTVVVTRTDRTLAEGLETIAAQVAGYRLAAVAAIAIALLGMVAGVALHGGLGGRDDATRR